MGEVVNLRQARKRRAKSVGDENASLRRAEFGLTKAEREKIALEQDFNLRRLDGHRREARDDDSA